MGAPDEDLFTQEDEPGGLPEGLEIDSYRSSSQDSIESRLQDAIDSGDLYDFQYSYGVRTRCRVRNKHSDYVTARSSHTHRDKHELHLMTADNDSVETYPTDAEVDHIYGRNASSIHDSVQERNEEGTVLDIEIAMGYKDKNSTNYALIVELPED